MTYSTEYIHPRVTAEIERWPAGILSDHPRIVERVMEFGPPLRMPRSRAMDDGFFELRPRSSEGTGSGFYCFVVDQNMVVPHAFIEKTQETPERELKLARKRMKEVSHG